MKRNFFYKLYHLSLNYKKKYRLFVNYALIGSSGVFLHFIIFFLLQSYLLKDAEFVWICYLIAATCGLTNNFVWNAFFNFRTGKNKIIRRYISFGIVGGIGMALATPIVQFLTSILKFDPYIATLFGVVISAILQFFLNKHFSFNFKN